MIASKDEKKAVRSKCYKYSVQLLIVTGIIFCNYYAYSQSIKFQKNYGINSGGAKSIIQRSDSGYTIVGSNYQSQTLTSTDKFGVSLWQKQYNKSNYFFNPTRVLSTIDNGYAMFGYYYPSSSINSCKELFIKTDSLGNLLWAKSYWSGGINFTSACDMDRTTDGGFILLGHTCYSTQVCDIFLTKIDSLGNIVWSLKYGGNNSAQYANSVKVLIDGSIIVSGMRSSSLDPFLLKFSSSGNIIWNKKYQFSFSVICWSLDLTYDEGLIVAGVSNPSSGPSIPFLMKTDSAGNFIWSKTYSYSPIIETFGVKSTNDRGLILTLEPEGFDTVPGSKFGLLKTDSIGNIEWSKIYNHLHPQFPSQVIQTLDNGYASIGICQDQSSIYFLKTDSLGNSGCNNDTVIGLIVSSHSPTISSIGISFPAGVDSLESFSMTNINFVDSNICDEPVIGISHIDNPKQNPLIFPNPISNSLNIETNNYELSEIILYDLVSRKLLQQKFINSITLNTEQLSKGIYLYEVRNKNVVIKKGKVVKD